MEKAQRKDGQSYAPIGAVNHVCKPGEFSIGAVGLDHGHIYGMCNGLVEAGATVDLVWDRDQEKVKKFQQQFPSAQAAESPEAVYESEKIKLIATAAIPSDRTGIAVEAMKHGKHAFSDKPGSVSLDQLEQLRGVTRETGMHYAIYFSERLHVAAATYADELLKEGKIGRVIQVIVLGPHRLSAATRPDWFFDKSRFGGILTDIGSHQIDQILHYSGAENAHIVHSRVANYATKQYPEFEDFGDALLQCDNGATGYFRVDWFTPDGLSAWGDGRTIILGTDGYIELRKYVDLARHDRGDYVYMSNKEGEFCFDAEGAGYPFFGRFIRDCLDGTYHAIGQDYTFKVMELAVCAEKNAVRVEANR
ncbi:MAG TPA: Gfo/Idh/MocA family oxidoreductase [Spirochaetia bacterium]|nr:Gfo/Idh/MocA family oxidoreductase [Spirochaetia bacterium]